MKNSFWIYVATIWVIGYFSSLSSRNLREKTPLISNEAVNPIKNLKFISQGTAGNVKVLNLALRRSTHVLVFGFLVFLLVIFFVSPVVRIIMLDCDGCLGC